MNRIHEQGSDRTSGTRISGTTRGSGTLGYDLNCRTPGTRNPYLQKWFRAIQWLRRTSIRKDRRTTNIFQFAYMQKSVITVHEFENFRQNTNVATTQITSIARTLIVELQLF